MVSFATPHYSAFQLFCRYAGTSCKQLSATIAPIAVHRHTIPFVFHKRLSVAHTQDFHLLSVWLCDIHDIVYACGTVEVECKIFESAFLIVVLCGVSKEHYMVVGRRHGVHPLVVAHFEMFSYFLSTHLHHVDVVFVTVELEHVAHINISLLYLGIESEWCGKGNIGACY